MQNIIMNTEVEVGKLGGRRRKAHTPKLFKTLWKRMKELIESYGKQEENIKL